MNIEAEDIPNCHFLGSAKARLRIYRNRKISVDPTGRHPYLVSSKAWELLEEHHCTIVNGTLHVPEISLEASETDKYGIQRPLYEAVVVDEKGWERCALMPLISLMRGRASVIDGYDEFGTKKPISLTTISIEKTNKFEPIFRTDGKRRFKPKPGTRLEFVKNIVCVKQGGEISLPAGTLDYEPDANGDSTVIYVFLEKDRSGIPHYVATMHFEPESELHEQRAIIYRDQGPPKVTVSTEPIPECGHLGKSAKLRLYRNTEFSPDPMNTGKYVSEPNGDEPIRDVQCTITDDTLYIPDFDLNAHTRPDGTPTVLYTAMIVDESGVERGALFSDRAFFADYTKDAPAILKIDDIPSPSRNPLRVYRSRDFYFHVKNDRNAYEPKPGSLEYVMTISYEFVDTTLVIHQWNIEIDDNEISSDENETPKVIYRGIIVERGREKVAFTGYIAGLPPRLLTFDSERTVVKLFKRSPFRSR